MPGPDPAKSAICTVLDLLAQGRLKNRGLVTQESISLPDFLTNRFGRTFAGADSIALNTSRGLAA